MSYLIAILVLVVMLGASAAVVLIALARLVEVLPPDARAEEEEGAVPRAHTSTPGGPLRSG
jgi:hypothetical protein